MLQFASSELNSRVFHQELYTPTHSKVKEKPFEQYKNATELHSHPALSLC